MKLKQLIDTINNYPRAILNFKSATTFFTIILLQQSLKFSANKKEKVKKILVDTNFLIALLETKSFDTVNLFEKYQNSKYALYLSSIVHFEYLVNLKNKEALFFLKEKFIKLPFTNFDSEKILLFRKHRNYKVKNHFIYLLPFDNGVLIVLFFGDDIIYQLLILFKSSYDIFSHLSLIV